MTAVDREPSVPVSPVKRPHRVAFDAQAKLRQWGIDPAAAVDAEERDGPIVGACNQELPGGKVCPGQLRVTRQDGPIWEVECVLCGYAAGLPARHADPSLRRRSNLERSGLPERFLGKQFEADAENRDVLRALREWLGGFEPGRLGSLIPSPAIWGLQGRGKSHILAAVCVRLVRELDLTVLFRSARSLLRELQDYDGDAVRAYERLAAVDVLALDDAGAQRITDDRHDRLSDLIDARYEAERPIVVATNFPPSIWEQVMDERTRSRLAGMTFPLELRGVDRRTQSIEGEGQ